MPEESTVDAGAALDRLSVCEFTTPDLTFEEDLELYREIGAAGISICEVKLDDEDDDEVKVVKMRESGLKAAVCIPVNIAVLPADPLFPGPETIDDRVAAICDSIRRLARFEPASVCVITGAQRDLEAGEARQIAVEGLREAAEVAKECGVRLSIEPLRTDGGLDISLVRTVGETLELIAEIGVDNVDIAYDVYHLWDTPDVLEVTAANAPAVGGVHVCDWHEPPRGVGDRLVPGEGEMDLPPIIRALEGGGFGGWYDLEIFSDKELPDSLWKWPPRELVEKGRDGFLSVWDRASKSA